jgi:EpsI family protein
MRAETLFSALLVAALIAVGGLAWAMALRPALHGDPSVLASIPMTIAGFEAHDIPMEDTVENMLRADFNVQRAYEHGFGDVVWLYVGYYGTERGGTPEHTPSVCYGGNGWDVVTDAKVDFPDAVRGRAREFLVQQGAHRRLVLYWFRSFRGETLASIAALHVDHFIGRIRAGRADGALVRISTPLIDGDVQSARSRRRAFAVEVEPEIELHWPDEVAAS